MIISVMKRRIFIFLVMIQASFSSIYIYHLFTNKK